MDNVFTKNTSYSSWNYSTGWTDDDEVLDIPNLIAGFQDYQTQFQAPPLKDQVYEQDETAPETPPDETAPGEMGPESPINSIKDIGKVYTLKKIYVRLISLHNFLDSCNFELIDLKKKVNEALQLFRLAMFNIQKLDQDTISELIVNYYKFIKYSYSILDKYFKKKQQEEK